jgi:hypothetical protein
MGRSTPDEGRVIAIVLGFSALLAGCAIDPAVTWLGLGRNDGRCSGSSIGRSGRTNIGTITQPHHVERRARSG